MVLGVPVAVQLALQPLLRLGTAVPFQPALDRAGSGVEDEAGVRAQPLRVEQLGGVAARVPGAHAHGPVGEGGGDEVGDEAIELEPVPKLRVRRPVIAPLPAELLSLHAEDRGDDDRAGLVEQPVRLRLTSAEGRGRVEAVEESVAVEEEQSVLRATLRREEEQLELVGRQQLMVVEAEHDLAVALGQV
ncbi:MAG TPA: hypothetical protein VFB42_01080 [Gaiellaceae bacterium]|nr:hypothetical protein [Gaiellaceae bacterium]